MTNVRSMDKNYSLFLNISYSVSFLNDWHVIGSINDTKFTEINVSILTFNTINKLRLFQNDIVNRTKK